MSQPEPPPEELSIEGAYAVCESIARQEAKNFYYAFRVLPRRRRAAICAVYAFMRHADDLADDERLPSEQRLQNTQQWVKAWHRAATGEPTSNPVFLALRDAQARFNISTELLDQLLQGTMIDLTAATSDAANVPARAEYISAEGKKFAVYRDFNGLYRYCYYVASVVGLVCIKIFGYNDPQAEKLAEETGIAFQLTNILRDVSEDAATGRIYLPLEDLQQHEVAIEELTAHVGNRDLAPQVRSLMQMEAARARHYYKAANDLLPMIAPEGRAALWVLVTIYRRLLQRIEAADYQVFSAKIKVSTAEKIWILLRGFWMSLRLRAMSRQE
ncbi:MAG TPA: phytoene/squalene synthase family protein [Acidobacteriaceae bacterium]|nr:phytoene/squalene synthase family protein [Acidobacteriaceae bacterium]